MTQHDRPSASARTRVVVLGDRDVAHLTHRELDAALALLEPLVDIGWVATDADAADAAARADGVWLAPGTPYRDERAVQQAITACIRDDRPLLATCGGFQQLVLNRVRAAGAEAAHAETDPDAVDPVVMPLRCSLYGEVRPVTPRAGTRLAAICGIEPFDGYHYCGYGINPLSLPLLAEAGVVVSATAPDAGVEAIELPDRAFVVGTAFQPQVGSSERQTLHPLIEAFVQAAATSATPGGVSRRSG